MRQFNEEEVNILRPNDIVRLAPEYFVSIVFTFYSCL